MFETTTRPRVQFSIFVDRFNSDSNEIAARLSFCDGTSWASDAGLEGYEPDARVAPGNWSSSNAADSTAELMANGERAAHNLVRWVRIECAHLRDLRKLVAPLRDEAQRSEARRELRRCALSIAATLPESCGWRLATEPIHIGVAQGPGGRANTTINEETGLHVGLHLDSFDRLPPEERRRGSNRLCVNLGEARRALQFVPIEASKMVSLLHAHGVDVPEEWPRREGRKLDLARTFLATYPETPVFRLRLDPGEGYLAPTENLIHDGISEDARWPDVTMTIRGYFVPCGPGPLDGSATPRANPEASCVSCDPNDADHS